MIPNRTLTPEEALVLTPEEALDARHFSFASAIYRDPVRCHRFVVLTPWQTAARLAALRYCRRHWGEPAELHTYPRTYVRDARALVAAGHWTR